MSKTTTSADKKKVQKRARMVRESQAAYAAQTASAARRTRNPRAKKLVREMRGGQVYEYYPLGRFVVVAPQVAGVKPIFKCTRVRVKRALDMIADGATIQEVAEKLDSAFIPPEAIREALDLARKAFAKAHPSLRRLKRVI